MEKDHRVVLDAINDRGITRLALPDRPKRDIEHRPKEVDAALDRIVSVILYSPTGKVHAPEFSIRCNNERSAFNPKEVLRLAQGSRRPTIPNTVSSGAFKERDTSFHDWIERRRWDTTPRDRERAEQRRIALQDETGLPSESYRFANVAEALHCL